MPRANELMERIITDAHDLRDEINRLRRIEERAQMKVRQLESGEFEEFGGLGTGEAKEQRQAYIRALRWALGKEVGEV